MTKPTHGVRAAVYARVSTTEQARDGTSLLTQVDRGTSAVKGEGWVLVDTFVDEGVSGALASRPQLDALLRLVEDSEVDRVVITKVDRIARSLRNLLELLATFERHGVELVALDDPLDLASPTGRAMVQLRGTFAELERGLTRERMMEGILSRVHSGRWVGGPPPYGFRTVPAPDGHGKVLVVDEGEAATVRLAYSLLVEEGLTSGMAADRLNQLGSKPRRASRWTHHNLRRLMLDGTGLSGRWVWRRAGRAGRTKDDEIVVEVPAILTREEHDQLRAVLAMTSTPAPRKRPYLLRQRVWSPHGVRMQGVPGHGGRRYYRCPTATAKADPRCECGRLNADDTETVIWDEILALLGSPQALETLAIEAEAARGQHASRERSTLAELDQRIEALRDQIAGEYAALIADGFDAGAARKAIARRNDTLRELVTERDQVARLRSRNLAAASVTSRLRELAEHARTTLASADDELKRRIIDLLDVEVQVDGWDICEACAGKGLVPNPDPQPSPDGRRPTGLVCPNCRRSRRIPRITLTGAVPELLLTATDIAEVVDIDNGDLFPFRRRVA